MDGPSKGDPNPTVQNSDTLLQNYMKNAINSVIDEVVIHSYRC